MLHTHASFSYLLVRCDVPRLASKSGWELDLQEWESFFTADTSLRHEGNERIKKVREKQGSIEVCRVVGGARHMEGAEMSAGSRRRMSLR